MLSRYPLLPAIGSPTHDLDDSTSSSYSGRDHQRKQPHNFHKHAVHSSSSSESRETNAVPSREQHGELEVTDFIERLDLSQLDRHDAEKGRRKKSLSGSSPSQAKHKNQTQPKLKSKAGEVYDADDDDSDTPVSPRVVSSRLLKPHMKKPVIIPSPDCDTSKELLLAIKLPIDGKRHQKIFNSNETLQTIIDFAEDVSGQDFSGYILVCSAPKHTYRDLGETIESVGLEDKSVLHLEQGD